MNKIKTTSHRLPIAANMKLADVIHLDYLLIPIIGRFGIELGFGNKTIQEVCNERNIHLSFFLEIINSYHNHDYFPEDELQDYPISLIVEYLSNTHNYYLNYKIPELDELVKLFIESSSKENEANNKLIANFYEKYKKELIRHLKLEEANLFPYSNELKLAVETTQISEALLIKIRNNYISKNDDDHFDLEEKLDDLKNLIIKFLPPVQRKDLLEKLLIELFRLENDLNDHSRIEDKVLIPKIIQLENKIIALSDTQEA